MNSIEEIKEILNILAKNKIQASEVLSTKRNGSKTLELFDLIQKDKVQTNTDAIRILYGGVVGRKQKAAFSKVLNLLKSKLLNGFLFFSTCKNNNPTDSVYFESQRQFLEIKILLANGGIKIGVPLARRLILKAERYELWDIALFLLRFLRRMHVRSGQLKEFDKYDKKLKEIQQTYNVLVESEGMYYRLMSQVVTSKAPSPNLIKEAKTYEKQLDKVEYKLPSARIIYYKYAISTFILFSTFQYEKAEILFEKSLKELRTYRNIDTRMLMTFVVNLASCNIYLKQFDKGRINLNVALKTTEEGGFNWIQIKSIQIILAFHAGAYDELLSIYINATTHSGFGKLPPIYAELWRIYFAWIRILEKAEKLKLPKKYTKGKYSITNFLTNKKEFSKDKEGLNVTIIIWKFLWYLTHEDYEKLDYMETGLRKYRYRYAKKKNRTHQRAFLMLKYLGDILVRDFQEYRCDEITATAKRKLAKKALSLQWGNYDIEIIPFDAVVPMVEEILKINKRRLN